jgi:putative glycosyltransferase (TIGR04372 family)
MKYLKNFYRAIRKYISLLILTYFYLSRNNKDTKLILYLSGSILEINILRKYLLRRIRSKIDNSNLASYLYLSGYCLIARSIYRNDFYNNKKNKIGKYYFSAENFKAIGHTAFIATFIREALLNGPPYPKFYFDQKDYYDNPRLLESYITSFPELFPENVYEGSVLNNIFKVKLGFIESDNEVLWFDEWSHKIENLWSKSKLINRKVVLGDEYILGCKKLLQESYKLMPNDKFIVIHIRESSSSKLMNLRDSKPETYKLAIEELIECGFHVFRIGFDSSSFRLDNCRYHDMTQNKSAQQLIDLYLFSHCHAFIGTGSGPANVMAQVFHKPSLFVNIAPLRSRVPSQNQTVLPKMYKKKCKGEKVSLDLRCGAALGHLESKSALKKMGMVSIDNTPNQIKEAAIEFIKSIDCFGKINSSRYIIQDPIKNYFSSKICGQNYISANISSSYNE